MASNWKLLTVSYGRKIILLALLLNIDVCVGIASTSIDCTNGGIPGQNKTIVCTITDTITHGIQWMRPNGGMRYEIVLCNTANTTCSSFTAGYTGHIDSPTQHTLTIESFDTTKDIGQWICRDGPNGNGPMSCNMTLFIPVPNPENQVSESTISIIVVVAVLLVVAVAVSWFYYKRMKRQPKAEEEKTKNKQQEAQDQTSQHDNPALEMID
ncbi:uncharacterized protein LOC121386280 [Gigantopelta aegis]|uniref:uncharacterized protein LOC121386280 n=1 Tax=Gigantopelta aegis TaxID=1735272 RepID=UPI001B8895FB|nr:uncharacterized protein LOC121386280 [Gigantopelta aegis]